jgi:hypothetical protein
VAPLCEAMQRLLHPSNRGTYISGNCRLGNLRASGVPKYALADRVCDSKIEGRQCSVTTDLGSPLKHARCVLVGHLDLAPLCRVIRCWLQKNDTPQLSANFRFERAYRDLHSAIAQTMFMQRVDPTLELRMQRLFSPYRRLCCHLRGKLDDQRTLLSERERNDFCAPPQFGGMSYTESHAAASAL